MGEDDNAPDRNDPSLAKLNGVLWMGTGIALLALAASQGGGAPLLAFLAAVGIGVLIFLAAFASGALAGFLFGIPRTLAREQTPQPAPAAAPAPAPLALHGAAAPAAGAATATSAATAPSVPSRVLQSNTNLERISDWLTTLLVGASLVQLHAINDGLLGFRDFLASHALLFDNKGVPTAGVLPVAGPIVLVFGAVCGFLYMYLSTRLVLSRLFYTVERYISGERLGGEAQRNVQSVIQSDTGLSPFLQNQLSQKSRLTVNDALNAMLNLLYKSAPEQVIEIGANLANTDAVNRAQYWYYMAAAFGQQLRALPPGSAEFTSARDNALDCAQRAVALDPTYRDQLWAISDPNSSDDDLAPLRDDPTFRRIVGRP